MLLTLGVRIIDLPPQFCLLELVVSFIAGVVKYALFGAPREDFVLQHPGE
jgi:hypothetical protein